MHGENLKIAVIYLHAQDPALHNVKANHLTWKTVSPYNVTSEFLFSIYVTLLYQEQDADKIHHRQCASNNAVE